MYTVAIVGRPNVGKSTLFNRLAGKKHAIVDDMPGLTRDWQEATADIGGTKFKIIDTAGLEDTPEDQMTEAMMAQTEQAILHADLVMFVIDGLAGVTPMDSFFAKKLRTYNTPIILIANKCENSGKALEGIQESYRLGLEEPVAVSAEHGLGIADLYDALIPHIKEKEMEDADEDDSNLQLAIVGRPNVGKSTLFNRLLGEDRAIASEVAGTTRDAIYVKAKYEGQVIQLVDTAGIRKRGKRVGENVENMSVKDSYEAIQYAHVVCLILDATLGLESQDIKIAEHAWREGRCLIIGLNKIDLVDNPSAVKDEIRYTLSKSLAQAYDVPVISFSAKTSKKPNLEKIYSLSFELMETWNKRMSTSKLNDWLADVLQEHPPPLHKGKRVKLRYITQIKSRPPTFALFTTSNIKQLKDSYQRYLLNRLREDFGFDHVPLRLLIRKSDNPYVSNKK